MRVGDYVRTKSGYIGKITSIDNEMNRVYYYTKKETSAVPTQNIVKYVESEEQIINLIEVGDYVNGYKISKITQYADMGTDLESEFIDTWNYGNKYVKHIGKKDIKSIVTKEQFESKEYRIGE